MAKLRSVLVIFCLLWPLSTASALQSRAQNKQDQFCWWQAAGDDARMATAIPEATATRDGNSITTVYPHAGNFGCDTQTLETTHTWTEPPSQLNIGKEVSFEVSAAWNLVGTRECTSLTAGVHTSITAGVTTIAAKRSNIPISKEPSDSVSNTGSWMVPVGSQPGEKLTLLANANTGAGGGTVTYTYVYTCMDVADKTQQAGKKTETPKPTETPWAGAVCKEYSPDGQGYTRDNTWGDSGCRFSDFSGEVIVYPCYDPEEVALAELDLALAKGDVIQTEADSIAILSFADMTTFHMKPFTKVFLEVAPARQSSFSLLYGKVMANVKKMIETGEMNVVTTDAVSGTKGTIFSVEKTDQATILKVIDGTVSFTSRVSGQSVDVHAGEQIQASSLGLGQITPLDIQAEIAAWPEAGLSLSEEVPLPSGPAAAGRPQWMRWVYIGAGVLGCFAGLMVLGSLVGLFLWRRKQSQKETRVE